VAISMRYEARFLQQITADGNMLLRYCGRFRGNAMRSLHQRRGDVMCRGVYAGDLQQTSHRTPLLRA
jgi:hypothetical protein